MVHELSCRTAPTYCGKQGALGGSTYQLWGSPRLGSWPIVLYNVHERPSVCSEGSPIVQLYADDTVIYVAGENSDEAAAKLQPSLNSFSKWCSANKLSLNTNKTKMMVFGTRNKVKKAKNVVLKLEGSQLQVVPTYKYLGFTLDSVLSFNYHVKNVSNMVAYKTNLLGKVRKFLNEDVALKIYKSMILPYFDYGDVVYNSANNEGLDKLQRLQNRCLKIFKRLNVRHNTKNLHNITNTSMLKDRRIAHLNNFMYGRLSRENTLDQRDIRTRAHDAPMFLVKVPKLEAYKRSVEYTGAIQWNNLPPDVRNIDNVANFKQTQKTLLLKKLE